MKCKIKTQDLTLSWNQNRYDGANLGTTTLNFYDEPNTNRAAAVANIAQFINDCWFWRK